MSALDARLSAMIRHINDHNSFPKHDLIQLLKDVQADRAETKRFLDESIDNIDATIAILQRP